MITKIPSLIFYLFILYSFSFYGCRSHRDISGKWTASYVVKQKPLGTIDMKFILNINKNFKYSMTRKGTIQKHNLTKVFSRKSGVWTIESGLVTFTPIICSKANQSLILEEVECDSAVQSIKVSITDNTWEYQTSDGRSLKLNRQTE